MMLVLVLMDGHVIEYQPFTKAYFFQLYGNSHYESAWSRTNLQI